MWTIATDCSGRKSTTTSDSLTGTNKLTNPGSLTLARQGAGVCLKMLFRVQFKLIVWDGDPNQVNSLQPQVQHRPAFSGRYHVYGPAHDVAAVGERLNKKAKDAGIPLVINAQPEGGSIRVYTEEDARDGLVANYEQRHLETRQALKEARLVEEEKALNSTHWSLVFEMTRVLFEERISMVEFLRRLEEEIAKYNKVMDARRKELVEASRAFITEKMASFDAGERPVEIKDYRPDVASVYRGFYSRSYSVGDVRRHLDTDSFDIRSGRMQRLRYWTSGLRHKPQI